MARKGQTFQKYDIDFKLKLIKEKQKGTSYNELSKEYDIPEGTIATWMRIFKKNGTLDLAQRGRPTDKAIDYKERYEILKKFQDFSEKKEQKKR